MQPGYDCGEAEWFRLDVQERDMAVEIQNIDLNYPHARLLRRAAKILENGGLIVYPTDTIYGLGADLLNKKALERIFKIKRVSKHKLLSFICPNLKNITEWAYVPNNAYRIMRRVTPGKYTFILRASPQVPKILLQKRQTVGIRIPDSPIALGLAIELGRPLLSTSVPMGEDGFYSDPQEIAEQFKFDIDLILDAGVLSNQPSTIVDFTKDKPQILREGSGDVTLLH
jgi:tRNA threonylcarbamoyl adenosine modification protein (Sua5/YciO/YrdC/YwlC family)